MLTLPLGSSSGALLAPWRGARTTRWSAAAARAVDLLLEWHERARQRRQLQSLSDPMLRDLGLDRAEIAAETAKPFWRP